jgi:TonB-dependent receptor
MRFSYRLGSRREQLLARASLVALTTLIMATPALAADDPTPAPTTEVTEVVVTGQRASIENAEQRKKNAEQLIDSITAVDIGALPDRSVTEALQRISGVTITRTPEPRDADRISVEGSGVQIRGLSYVRAELNGRDSFSAKNGRALNFDDVPAELMAGVDVYKNPSADLIEGGLGGTVNLRTRLPFDSAGHLLAFSVDESYGDLVKTWKPGGSVLASDRWQTPIGEIGFLLDLSDSKFESRTDTFSLDPYFARTNLVPGKTVFVPGGYGFRSLDFNRERQGIATAAQWRPNDQILVTAQFIRSAAYSTEQEHAVGFDPSANVFPSSGTSFTYDSQGRFVSGTFADFNGGSTNNPDVIDDRFNTTRSVTSDYSVNLKYNPNDHWSFNFDVQYIKSKTKALDFTLFDSIRQALPAATLTIHGNGIPTVTAPDSSAYLSDPANYYWDAAMDFHDRNDADEWAESFEGAYTFDSDWLKSFRFGLRGTQRDAVTRETPFNWGYVTQTWAGAGLALLNGQGASASGNSLPAQFNTFSNFFRGDVKLPVHMFSGADGFLANFPAAAAAIMAAENRSASCCGPWTPFNGNYNQFTTGGGSGGTNTQSEDTLAGFGMLRFGHDLTFGGSTIPMDGNFGVRVVQTKAQGSGAEVFESNGINGSMPASDQAFANGAVSKISGGRTYTDVLPSLNLRFKLQDDLFLRFAAAQSIVRPDFAQMQPTLQIFATGGLLTGGTCVNPFVGPQPNCVFRYTAFEGNPNLKPIRSNQYDMSLEWYFSKSGILTGTVFAKDIYDFISTGVTTRSFTNNGATKDVLVTQPINEGHGTVHGAEFTYQQYYDMLPGVLRGVGFQGNITFIDSKGARNPSADPYDPTQIANAANQVHLPLEGLSRLSYNATLLYDLGPVSARLAWNWREKFLMTTSAANINIPAWYGDYGQLDASVFYSFSSHLKVGIEAANLTDSRSEILVSYPTTPNPGMTGHNWVDADRRISLVLRGEF